jgi:hypothetical protein
LSAIGKLTSGLRVMNEAALRRTLRVYRGKGLRRLKLGS